jgi:hypothetical protein
MKVTLTEKLCHFGKDGTVVALAPVTGNENYFPVPVVLSSSCKAKTGNELAVWVSKLPYCYEIHPDGQARHGPIRLLATDGESSFRNLRFLICLIEEVPRNSPLGKYSTSYRASIAAQDEMG